MKMNKLSAVLLVLLVATPAFAAKNSATDPVREQYSPRGQLVYDIVNKWGPHVQEVYQVNPSSWASEMGPIFKSASMDQLQRAANSNDFNKMNDVLLGKQAQSGKPVIGDPQTLLGDAGKDLVYTPVAPCRIFDTRLAGGKIPAGAARHFDVNSTSNYTAQGGSNTNCGVGQLNSFAAAVISFTVVEAGTAPSFLTAYAYNTTRPVAATMAYSGGNLVSNSAVVPLDMTSAGDEMTVYLNGTAHVVGDIVGYYDAPAATPLDCKTVTGVETSVAPLGNEYVDAGACPAGYTQVSLNCDATNFQLWLAGERASIRRCYFHNSSTTLAHKATASVNCCRVPGK